MLGFGFSPDALAEHTGQGQAKGCDNANDNSSVREQNPHCEEEAGPIDCDTNDSGTIDALELQAARGSGTEADNQTIINNVETAVGDNTSGDIDTVDELAFLNAIFLSPDSCLALVAP